jgi:hypothetical protein
MHSTFMNKSMYANSHKDKHFHTHTCDLKLLCTYKGIFISTASSSKQRVEQARSKVEHLATLDIGCVRPPALKLFCTFERHRH